MDPIKRWLFGAFSLLMLVFTGVWAWGSPFVHISAPAANAQEKQKDRQKNDADQAVIYTGTVVKDGDQFTLRDSSGAVYLLDAPDWARQFEGKPVKVTGRLGTEAKIIQVETIEIIPA